MCDVHPNVIPTHPPTPQHLPDTPTTITWLDTNYIAPCLAVACAGSGLVVLSHAGPSHSGGGPGGPPTWVQVAHCTESNATPSAVVVQRTASVVVAAEHTLMQVSLLPGEKGAGGGGTVLHRSLQLCVAPTYHPQVCVVRGVGVKWGVRSRGVGMVMGCGDCHDAFT